MPEHWLLFFLAMNVCARFALCGVTGTVVGIVGFKLLRRRLPVRQLYLIIGQ